MIPPTHAISNAMNSSSSNSPSRATRNVSIVEGGVGGTTTTGHSSPSTVGEDATVGPLAGRTAVIPAEEGDLSRQQAISVAVLEEAIPAASVDHTSGATDAEGGGVTENDGDEANEEDDGSEYSYTYEDEDETHYSGFLIPTDNPFDTAAAAASGEAVVAETGDDSLTSGTHVNSISRTNSRVSDGGGRSTPATVPETNPQEKDLKQKWREPTRAAVDMSLRAEKEKTGGKRRLASDLYKIMMADTSEAGFSLEPADEDSMEKWRIKLFDFDADSNLAKDLLVCGLNHVELEMSFPDQYPFEPPFVRVVQPRFKRQTGFVMSGALCMELLTKDGWNPVNDIESVIVSIRSIMAIGDGRLQAATELPKEEYKKVLAEATLKSKAKEEVKSEEKEEDDDAVDGDREAKRKRVPSEADEIEPEPKESSGPKRVTGGSYTASEAKTAYQHLSKYHEKEGWDKSGWWARKG